MLVPVLVVATLFGSCAGEAPTDARPRPEDPVPPAGYRPGDATTTFHVHGGKGLDQDVEVVLSATKAGRGSIVDATHTFPVGATATAIAGYYENLLLGAGWEKGKDFVVSGNSIHFYEPTAVSARSGHEQLVAGTTVDPARPR
jgi:hypothetical protein